MKLFLSGRLFRSILGDFVNYNAFIASESRANDVALVVVIVVATPTDQLLKTRDPYSRVDLAFVANVEGAMDRGGVA